MLNRDYARLRDVLGSSVYAAPYSQNWKKELNEAEARYRARPSARSTDASERLPTIQQLLDTCEESALGRKRTHSEVELDHDSGLGDIHERSSSRAAMPPPPRSKAATEPKLKVYHHNGGWQEVLPSPSKRSRLNTAQTSQLGYPHAPATASNVVSAQTYDKRLSAPVGPLYRAPATNAGPSRFFHNNPTTEPYSNVLRSNSLQHESRSHGAHSAKASNRSQSRWIENPPNLDQMSFIKTYRPKVTRLSTQTGPSDDVFTPSRVRRGLRTSQYLDNGKDFQRVSQSAQPQRVVAPPSRSHQILEYQRPRMQTRTQLRPSETLSRNAFATPLEVSQTRHFPTYRSLEGHFSVIPESNHVYHRSAIAQYHQSGTSDRRQDLVTHSSQQTSPPFESLASALGTNAGPRMVRR